MEDILPILHELVSLNECKKPNWMHGLALIVREQLHRTITNTQRIRLHYVRTWFATSLSNETLGKREKRILRLKLNTFTRNSTEGKYVKQNRMTISRLEKSYQK